MANASYRERLWTAVCQVLYTPNSSVASGAVIIPSLDLVKIICRLAAPSEMLAVWQRSSLHALDIVPSKEFDAGVRVDNCQLIAKFSTNWQSKYQIDLPPVALDFSGASAAGGGGGGVGVSTRRYVVSIRPGQRELVLMPSTFEDAATTSASVVDGKQLSTDSEPTGVVCRFKLDPEDARRFNGLGDAPVIALPPPRSSVEANQSVGSLFVVQGANNQKSGLYESYPVRFDLFVPVPAANVTRDIGTGSGGLGKITRTPLQPPPFGRTQPTLAFDPVTQMVYMCGGTNDSGNETPPDQKVESARYSVIENRWWILPAVRHNRRIHAAAIYRSHLVMAGGYWGENKPAAVEALALDPGTGDRATPTTEWVDWPSPSENKQAANYFSLVVLDDRLYMSWFEQSTSRRPARTKQRKNKNTNPPSPPPPCAALKVWVLAWDNPPPTPSPTVAGPGGSASAPIASVSAKSVPVSGRWCPIPSFPEKLFAEVKGFLLSI